MALLPFGTSKAEVMTDDFGGQRAHNFPLWGLFWFPFPLAPVLVFISAAFPTPAAVEAREARSSPKVRPSACLGHARSVPAAARSPVWPVPHSGAPAR